MWRAFECSRRVGPQRIWFVVGPAGRADPLVFALVCFLPLAQVVAHAILFVFSFSMSLGDDLWSLASQITMLASLEDSIVVSTQWSDCVNVCGTQIGINKTSVRNSCSACTRGACNRRTYKKNAKPCENRCTNPTLIDGCSKQRGARKCGRDKVPTFTRMDKRHE